jgi:hypothetical protein
MCTNHILHGGERVEGKLQNRTTRSSSLGVIYQVFAVQTLYEIVWKQLSTDVQCISVTLCPIRCQLQRSLFAFDPIWRVIGINAINQTSSANTKKRPSRFAIESLSFAKKNPDCLVKGKGTVATCKRYKPGYGLFATIRNVRKILSLTYIENQTLWHCCWAVGNK